MSNKPRWSRILQDVTNCSELKEQNVHSNAPLNCDQSLSGKENKLDSAIVKPGRLSKNGRVTASMIVFEEEPVFLDSEDAEEETEYHRQLFEMYRMDVPTSETPRMVDVAVQCNIISNEMVLKDLIKECAKFNVENVREDFKLVILHCKQLESKYGSDIPSLSKSRAVGINNGKVNEIQLSQDEPNVMSSVKYPNSSTTSSAYSPTKERDNTSFSSGSVDFGTNLRINGIIETLGEVNKSSDKESTKPAINGKGRCKATYKTINTKRYETRAKKLNGSHKTLDPKQDSSIAATSSTNGRRLRKRSHPESIANNRAKRIKTEKPEIVKDTCVKSNMRSKGNSKRKLPKLTLEYISENIKLPYISILLPKRQTRAMGKNWVNFKRIIKARMIPVFRGYPRNE